MNDYYKVLGVPRNATDAQIKHAYRKLIRVCHPDVNPSPKAAEWTRALNEAYSTLSDAKAKMSYDMDIKLERTKQGEESTRPGTSQQTRAESSSSQRPEPILCCERCYRTDSTLRVCATWCVFSFISYSRKTPTVKVLCNRCRVKESLAANATTALLGWWSFWGLFWTVEALFKNASGGEQPEESNAALLNALGDQLYRAGRHEEAYEALIAAFKIKPDPKTEERIRSLKSYARPGARRTLWERFRCLDLHPIFYHAPAGIVALILLVLGCNALTADSSRSSMGL